MLCELCGVETSTPYWFTEYGGYDEGTIDVGVCENCAHRVNVALSILEARRSLASQSTQSVIVPTLTIVLFLMTTLKTLDVYRFKEAR